MARPFLPAQFVPKALSIEPVKEIRSDRKPHWAVAVSVVEEGFLVAAPRKLGRPPKRINDLWRHTRSSLAVRLQVRLEML
jgi:hypothetical protein